VKLEDVDLLEDAWAQGVPHEAFDLLRREAPVHRHPEPDGGPGFWAITKHEDVYAISRDYQTFSSELGGTFVEDQTDEALAQMRLSILNMDPPKHERYRKLVNKAFLARGVGSLIESIERHAAEVVDEIIDRGECEFVEDVASRLPLDMICEMVGVPPEDWPQMFTWSNKLVGWDDPDFQTSPEEGRAAAFEIFQYCDKFAGERRVDPREDLMTALVEAEVDGERMTDLEINLFFVTLIVAGTETTRNLISHSMLALIEHPEEAERLRKDPSLWTTGVEEMLRWGTSIHNFRRTATRDTEVRGVPIKANDKLVLYYMSANRDEEVFPDPHRFDVGRTPNEHVTFGGGGVHYCLGARLARAEITAIMRQLVNRLDDVELAAPVRRLRSDFINGIKEMRLKFRPAA
jgi:cholest-4-en-3-one 26-monooxygenase